MYFLLWKKPNVMVKYKWEGLYECYKATKAGHFSAYLEDEFKKKEFWRPEVRYVHWKIRYQGAKYHPKIKAFWQELDAQGIKPNMYWSINVSFLKEAVDKFYENDE